MVEFRPAVAVDLPGILELFLELNPEDSSLDPASAETTWAEILGNPRIGYSVAVDGGRIVGTCHVVVVPNLTRSGRPYAVIENFVVATTHHRQGIGRELMNLALDFARSNQCYKVMLQSSARRAEAHHFYENMGFDGSSKRGFVLALA